MSKDLTSKMHMKMKLFTLKIEEGGSVLSHIHICFQGDCCRPSVDGG
jgi:hypothetical protein